MGTLIRLTAVLACAIISISFLMFAVDEMDRGSKTQQDALAHELGDEASAPVADTSDEPRHGIGGAIDRASDALLAPFDFVTSTNAWVHHGVPALLGLLLYGVGLGMVANFLPKERRGSGDWRTA